MNETPQSPQKPSPSSEGEEDWKAEVERETEESIRLFNQDLAEAKRRGISLDELLREKGLL